MVELDLTRGPRPLPGRAALLGLGLAGLLLLPAAASAEDFDTKGPSKGGSSNHIGGVRPEVHADIGGYASLGAGFRLDVPIVPNGFLDAADDELAISAGMDVFFTNFYRSYYDGAPYLIPQVVLQWNFYTKNDWSFFPEAGVAFYIGNERDLPRGLPVYAAVAAGFGARYHFSTRNALLLRISTPTGLQVGLTF